jgi:hypothetical protein
MRKEIRADALAAMKMRVNGISLKGVVMNGSSIARM